MRPALRALAAFATLLSIGPALGLFVSISVTEPVCSFAGCAEAQVSGGVPPYTYAWGGGESSSTIDLFGPGSITVTVTDFEGTQYTANATVGTATSANTFSYGSGAYCSTPFWTHVASGLEGEFMRCSLFHNVDAPLLVNGSPDPSFMLGPGNPYEWAVHPLPGAQPGSTQVLDVVDANGCPFTWEILIGYPVEFPSISILEVQGACNGQANGSFLFAYGAEGHSQNTACYLRNSLGQVQQITNVSGTGGTRTFSGLVPGDYWLRQLVYPFLPGATEFDNTCGDSIQVTIPDLGNTCGNVYGVVYMDSNEDCVMGMSGSEPRVPGALLEFQPGPYYATAGTNGAYSINLPNGAYTMQQVATDVTQHCPAPPAPVNVSASVAQINVGDTSLVPLDAQVMLASGPARPGFQLNYTIAQTNLTPVTTGSTTTVFTFDPAMSFISSTPNPSNVSGNVLTWNQGALNAFQQRTITVRLQVPPDIGLVGSVLSASVSLSTTNTDAVTANNTAGTSVTVTASLDPNDKTALTSSQWSNELYYIDVDQWVDYTLRFQNTGTDTAFNVIVTDTLPLTLDPSTIIWGASSHNALRSLTGQGIVKFIFPNILLPQSGVNEPASHGYASFRIKPKVPLVPGTVIENVANIFFDFNPPVITEPSVLTAEFSTGIAEVAGDGILLRPNPADDLLDVLSASDAIDHVRILALDGRVLLRADVRSTKTAINTGELPSGAYVLVATDLKGITHHTSFIVAHQ